MTIVELVTAVMGIASIALLALQVHVAAQTMREDHTRRCRQATLEYLIHDVRPHWKEELRQVANTFGDVVPMPEAVMNRLRSDSESSRLVIKMLGNIEHMAVGVNIGVYDIATIDRASGAFLIRVFSQFLPYIRRAQVKLPTAYTEFERLALELCKRRGREPPHYVPQSKRTHADEEAESEA